MRLTPRMVVIAPCDAIEAKKATLAVAKWDGPAYIRFAREATPIITTEETPFSIGKAQEFFRSTKNPIQVGIIATGSVVHNALFAAKELDEAGVGVVMLNMATVKPLDEEAVLKLAGEVKGIVTVEEHQRNGGLGGAVAELLAQSN